jgi:hypothetical protein
MGNALPPWLAGLVRRGKIIPRLTDGHSHAHVAQAVGIQRRVVRQGAKRFLAEQLDGPADAHDRAAQGGSPPAVAIHRLSQRVCAELAGQLVSGGLAAAITAALMRGLWAVHQREPGRHHLGLFPTYPREAGFSRTISALIELYTRPRRDDALVLSLDEKTSLSPRPWLAPTRPAQPQNRSNPYEPE